MSKEIIKMYTASTAEIDEIEDAVSEIKSKIDFTALKKNSAGLLFCHKDFVDSGVVAALCAELPFSVIGMSSMATADKSGWSLYNLTLTVLTSDEVSFEAGMTGPLDRGNFISETTGLYEDIRGRAGGDPVMMFAFTPYIRDVAGYEILDVMDGVSSGVPIWGSVSNGIDFRYDAVWTICNGKTLSEGAAMMFVRGPVKPKFIVSSIPWHNITDSRAVITRSEGAMLYEINDMPLREYLASTGMEITQEVATATPFMMYYKGAPEPVALGFYTLFDDGSALVGGPMPEGTQFALGNIHPAGILESAETGLKKILECENRQATLILPCVTRYIMLSPNQDSELRLIEAKLAGGEAPFAMGYSGGEICPMLGDDGKWHNRFHNYSFTACIL